MLKRLFDIVSSGAALLVLAPLLLLVALLIKLEDGGPVLFRQRRIGRGGRDFTLLKFRSMPVDTPHVESAQAATLRVTRIGGVIRRTNIDELPQLLNILRGDMSVVGPRPALPSQVRLVELRTETGAIQCRPGLTGLAQIRAYDGMPETEKAQHDTDYARRVTFFRDLGIIFRTFGYLTRRPPVY